MAVDINVPNENDFNSEVKSRPSEVDPYSNGHNGDAVSNFTKSIDHLYLCQQIKTILHTSKN